MRTEADFKRRLRFYAFMGGGFLVPGLTTNHDQKIMLGDIAPQTNKEVMTYELKSEDGVGGH